ncbi:MAG: DUF192 domain-containing protein [Aquificaceae bacterium]|nr:DUF192 domain-containing protein [Aquificaceae bacterium]MCX7989077.1 DUF192 domain-containing protein [Aquificaceae bacterium]
MLMIFNIICTLLVLLSLSYSQVRQCRLLLAETPEKHARGLMGYKSLQGFDGMVFLYGERAVRRFWNKDTHLELDLYWIDRGKVIGRSYLPPVELAGIVVVSSPGPVDRVVELLRGTKCMYGEILLSPELEGGKGNYTQQD